jgi:hypothetical protein
MNAGYTVALILMCGLSGLAVNAVSQNIDQRPAKLVAAPQAAHQHDPLPRPTNLKVLPKEMSGGDVDKLMHQYEQQLGVTCGFCHVENEQTRKLDYASDENSVKSTARMMIAMTNDLNTKYLAQLGDRRYADPLTCGNCHQGQAHPPVFEPRGNTGR